MCKDDPNRNKCPFLSVRRKGTSEAPRPCTDTQCTPRHTYTRREIRKQEGVETNVKAYGAVAAKLMVKEECKRAMTSWDHEVTTDTEV